MFSEARKRLVVLAGREEFRRSREQIASIAELQRRLKQLDFFLQRARSLAEERSAFQTRVVESSPRELAREDGSYAIHVSEADEAELERFRFELLTTTESFYFFAWRTCELIKSRFVGLSGGKRFDAPGVRIVRNQLLQHPERADSLLFDQSWSYSAQVGVQMKALRQRHEAGRHEDLGLYVNAREMAQRLESLFASADTDV